jgi:hypothetical protein
MLLKNNILLFSFSENGNEAEVTRDTSQNHLDSAERLIDKKRIKKIGNLPF